jgi:hypothetical protein
MLDDVNIEVNLSRQHTAAILWTDPRCPDQAALARAADALGGARHSSGAAKSLA